MSEEIILIASINVFPLNNGVMPEGYTEGDKGTSHPDNKFDPNAKEIVFMDRDTGKVIHYKMPGKLVAKIARDLKMNNKALDGQLQKEAADERARALLAGENGVGGLQLTPDQMTELRRNAG